MGLEYIVGMDNLTGLKQYFHALGMNDRAIAKVLGKTNMRSLTLIQQRLADLQKVLRIDAPTVVHMVVTWPDLLGHDGIEVVNKIQDYQKLLQIDEPTVVQMMINRPHLIGYNTMGEGPTAVKSKINKFTAAIPLEQLRDWVVRFPAILDMPAQAFKIRYMLAANLGITTRFFQAGFMTNQSKVWARACHLNRHPGIFNLANVYISEKFFHGMFHVSSSELMQKYPLDQTAVAQIEQDYLARTGHKVILDQQERAVLGLGA